MYAAVTQKDMVWFDMHMGVTEGVVQATTEDNQQGLIVAGGLMAKFSRSVGFFLPSNVLSTIVCMQRNR